MNQRFRNEDQNKYQEQFGSDPLFSVCNEVGPELQTIMPEFGMCPEEMYCESVTLLKWFITNPNALPTEINRKWHQLYNNYLGFNRSVNKEEIRLAVGVVFALSCLGLGTSFDTVLSIELPHKMIDCVGEDNHSFSGWASILDHIFDSCELPDGWLDDIRREITQKDTSLISQNSNPVVDAIREQTEVIRANNEELKKVAAKPTNIGQLNMGNGTQPLPPNINIPLIPEL